MSVRNPSMEVLKQVVDLVDANGPDTPELATARALIAEAGCYPNMHVGEPKETFEGNQRKIAEWLMGNIADAIDRRQWAQMNSILNLAHCTVERSDGEG